MTILNALKGSNATSVIHSSQFQDAAEEKVADDTLTTALTRAHPLQPYPIVQHLYPPLPPCLVYPPSHLFNHHSTPHQHQIAFQRNSSCVSTGVQNITGKRHEGKHSGVGNVAMGANLTIKLRLITVKRLITFNIMEKITPTDLLVIQTFA